jgi:hypothetical protein
MGINIGRFFGRVLAQSRAAAPRFNLGGPAADADDIIIG